MNTQNVISTLAQNNIASYKLANNLVGITVGEWVRITVNIQNIDNIEINTCDKGSLSPVVTDFVNKYSMVRIIKQVLEGLK